MKVTVTKNLNVRVGEPKLTASCYQYLAPGSELEIDGKTYKGDKYRGNDNWYRDEANNYYWSGGVDSKNQVVINYIQSDLSKTWWLSQYKIDHLWNLGLSGKGVKIAILDTGLSLPHPDLLISKNHLFDATNSKEGINDLDGHGTHCSGIVKASNNGYGVTGIAFNCEFYFAKVYDDYDGDTHIKPWLSGFDWAINQGVDIISFSRGKQESFKDLESRINRALGKGILVISASGNNGPDNRKPHVDYPSRYDGVLSVGGVDQNRKILNSTISKKESDLFAPGFEINSTFKNSKYSRMTGSSQATPFVAGVAALLLEKSRMTNKEFSGVDLLAKLIKNSDSENGIRIINPLKSLENL